MSRQKHADDRAPTVNDELLDGVRDTIPVFLPVALFAMMFGAAASASGHTVAMAVWASASIFAGASQFVFLDVYKAGVPVWSVVLAVFAVNFRHILYSAAMGGKIAHFPPLRRLAAFFLLTDLQFAVVEKRFENHDGKLPTSMAYYFGFGIPTYLLWIAGTFAGAVFGTLLSDPSLVGLDFVLPIYFLSILMGFRTRSRFAVILVVSALVAVAVQKTIGPPWHISIGGVSGILAASLMTIMQGRQTETRSGDRPEVPPQSKTFEGRHRND